MEQNLQGTAKTFQETVLASLNSLQISFNDLHTKVDKIDTKVNTKLEEIDTKLKEIDSKLGNVYEISVRTEIRRQYGETFARPFLINGLYGATRLLLPKGDQFQEAFPNTAELQASRASEIAQYLVTEKPVSYTK